MSQNEIRNGDCDRDRQAEIAFRQHLLTGRQLAERWQLASPKKLQADRVSGNGCPFVRIGRCVRYRLSDVLAYEAANLRISTSEWR